MTSTRPALRSFLPAAALLAALAPFSHAAAQASAADCVDAGVDDAGISIDPTPPEIHANVLNATAGSNGWYVSNYDVQWVWTDFCSLQHVNSGCGYYADNSVDGLMTFGCNVTSGGGTTDAHITVKRDATPPVITLTGGGNYTVDKNVTLACTASDATSGIATTTCGTVAGSKPAYLYSLGVNNVSASATDVAGNTKTAMAIITVSVTPTSLCLLTRNLEQTSPKYISLPGLLRVPGDILATTACSVLGSITSLLKPVLKAPLIASYQTQVDLMVAAGWLTQAQGTALKNLSRSI